MLAGPKPVNFGVSAGAANSDGMDFKLGQALEVLMATEPEDDFEEEEVDVEELVKQGKRVPRAKRYRIRIDKERFVVTTQFITKPELLKLVA